MILLGAYLSISLERLAPASNFWIHYFTFVIFADPKSPLYGPRLRTFALINLNGFSCYALQESISSTLWRQNLEPKTQLYSRDSL